MNLHVKLYKILVVGSIGSESPSSLILFMSTLQFFVRIDTKLLKVT